MSAFDTKLEIQSLPRRFLAGIVLQDKTCGDTFARCRTLSLAVRCPFRAKFLELFYETRRTQLESDTKYFGNSLMLHELKAPSARLLSQKAFHRDLQALALARTHIRR